MRTTSVVITGLVAFVFVTALILIAVEKPVPSQAPILRTQQQTPPNPQLRLLEKRCLHLSERVDALTIAVSTMSETMSRRSQKQGSDDNPRDSKSTVTPSPSRKVDKSRLPDSFEALSLADLDQRFGLPDSTKASSQHYYKEGVAVELDESGLVDSVTFHGQFSSDRQDANGNYLGLFQKDGAWYRPKSWKFKGLKIGDSLQAALSRLGLCDKSITDINGNQYLHYQSLQITVKLSSGPRPVILGFRFGSMPATDVNGNVGF